jgi:glycosyltransferase involved in cell wall biosynthesis
MTPLVSFAITTHNEGEYIETLLNQLIPFCQESGDEIVILDDHSDDPKTMRVLGLAKSQSASFRLEFRKLNKDFAEHKNYLNSLCTGKYIFQIDADETLHPSLLENLHDIVGSNDIDLYLVPRINIVNGLTDDDIKRWGWRVNEKGHVMFPDYQTRLYRNTNDIKWNGKVHERIGGFKTYAHLPDEEEYCMIHIKDIDRQRKQNDFYQTI